MLTSRMYNIYVGGRILCRWQCCSLSCVFLSVASYSSVPFSRQTGAMLGSVSALKCNVFPKYGVVSVGQYYHLQCDNGACRNVNGSGN